MKETSHHRNPSTTSIPKLNKLKVSETIESIYSKTGLSKPLIIWTQSPLESYFAKAAIDSFCEKAQHYGWYYRWWDRASEGAVKIRENAVQSILDTGWRIGSKGTGNVAWSDLPVYSGDEDIPWKDIPPNTRLRFVDPNKDEYWTILLEAPSVNWDVQAAITKHSNDMIVDMWARYKFQMDHIDRKPLGGSRNMHLKMMREKEKLLCQKNLGFFPVKITHQKSGASVIMNDDFTTLRDFNCYIMPFEDICLISEPAKKMTKDSSSRLHCEIGPAALYPDGFQVFAWHGVHFPPEWLDQKPTAKTALSLRNTELRRVACEMIGWDSVLKQMKAKTINRDRDPEIGELLSLKGFSDIDEKFLRVRCGTGRDFVLPVPPDMRTARQANAWTWGLEGDQYKPEVRT